MGKFDTGSKRTVHLYARAWAEWIIQQQGLAVEAELSGEFQIIARSTDVLLQVQAQERGRFLSLTELQLQYRNKMPRRLSAYAALAREKYELEVYVTVIYLTPPPEEVILEDKFHTEFMGQIAHQDINVICLWEVDADMALALDNPALVPFVPLMRGGNTEQTLRKCVERVRREPDAEELEAVLTLFANLVMNKEVVKRIVGWSMKILKESPFYQEITALAREEGREEGREEVLETERMAHLQNLQRLIAYRYKVPTDHFDSQLQGLDIYAIKHLIDSVFALETLTEFEAKLAEYLQG